MDADDFFKELSKVDVKLWDNPHHGPDLSFIIKYVPSAIVNRNIVGIIPMVQRFQPDINDETNLFLTGEAYSLNLEGLYGARAEGLFLVKELYNLPDYLEISEQIGLENGFEKPDFNKIYRVDISEILQYTPLLSARLN